MLTPGETLNLWKSLKERPWFLGGMKKIRAKRLNLNQDETCEKKTYPTAIVSDSTVFCQTASLFTAGGVHAVRRRSCNSSQRLGSKVSLAHSK
jgi:hypothetical protein